LSASLLATVLGRREGFVGMLSIAFAIAVPEPVVTVSALKRGAAPGRLIE
jgi:Ca2+/Na+ antiporter